MIDIQTNYKVPGPSGPLFISDEQKAGEIPWHSHVDYILQKS
jgi:hypothetical protein